jgi:phosphatidylinositol alpha-mannosyltransferase
VRERLPLVLGTVVSQTLLNLLATAALGGIMLATVGLFRGGEDRLLLMALAPVAAIGAVLAAPLLARSGAAPRSARARAALASLRTALHDARRGLHVFRHPRLGPWAAVSQLGAWGLQWLACWALFVALGLDSRAGASAAAAVLFAVNVTAVLPLIPANIGIYQAACVAVLSAYGVGYTHALAYGIILQALEMATAVAMGMPALLRAGMSWRDMRSSALHATPVELRGHETRGRPAEA